MVTRFAAIVGTAFAACIAAVWARKKGDPYEEIDDNDALSTDSRLLRRNTKQLEYTVNGITYPSIRTFYHAHPQAEKLPTTPTPLPLLVFIHGLGGSVAQFNTLLTNLVNVSPCLAIDLPGCGLSALDPTDWEAYRLENLVALLAKVIDQHRNAEQDQKVVLIGHSLGCSLATLLVSENSPLRPAVAEHIIGMVAICPRAEPLKKEELRNLNVIPWIPVVLFDLFRAIDRRGGADSVSVNRFIGKDADEASRRLQLRYNEQSRSATFLRIVAGFRPAAAYSSSLPGPEIWSHIAVPLLCLAGEDDHMTPPSNVDLIAESLKSARGTLGDHQVQDALSMHLAGNANDLALPTGDTYHPPPFAFKSAVLPSPAGHGLMYTTSTIRVVSGLIQSFLAVHVDRRLSIGWQLQHLTTEGKWDVKNLEKWRKVQNVSEPIAGVFRAMKTLREVDGEHTPVNFAKTWAARPGLDGGIAVVVDISHDSPVYDPKGLEDGGIEYHKFPSVSKLPPTADEVRGFLSLVDGLREDMKVKGKAGPGANGGGLIAVHCHYGFNRTGFFIIAYLVERMGYRLQDALELFAEKRPPGVRHEHFVDELFVRYAVGLKKAQTWR